MNMAYHANKLPLDFDDCQPRDYNPEFTADINTKMQVPDKILIYNGFGDRPSSSSVYAAKEEHRMNDQKRASSMNVPSKLVAVGQGESVGLIGDSGLSIDRFLSGYTGPAVSLTAPPRVLTLDDEAVEKTFLPGGSAVQASMKVPSTLQNGLIPTEFHRSRQQKRRRLSDDYESLCEEEAAADSMVDLRKRVQRLEKSERNRQRRDFLLYPLFLGFVLVQIGKWLMRK